MVVVEFLLFLALVALQDICLLHWNTSTCCVATHIMYIQPIPLGVTFSNAVSKLKAQSSNVSFHRNVRNVSKETFELWAFENDTPSWIGCTYTIEIVVVIVPCAHQQQSLVASHCNTYNVCTYPYAYIKISELSTKRIYFVNTHVYACVYKNHEREMRWVVCKPACTLFPSRRFTRWWAQRTTTRCNTLQRV